MRSTLLMFGLLIASGCADASRDRNPLQSQIGKNCIVYFRKDALGMGSDVPTLVTTGVMNGAEVTQIGELLEVERDWIVIGYDGRLFHIPRESIQMVEFGKHSSTRAGLSEPILQKASPEHGHHEH